MPDQTQVTIHPVSPSGGRRVVAHVHGEDTILGVAKRMADVREFLRRAGWQDEEDWPPLIWRGDGPDIWTPEDRPREGRPPK